MIIGLSGPAGAGKTTVAEILRHRHDFVPMAFADPLYAAVSVITGLSVDELQDRRIKETPLEHLGKSPRFLLQTLGTEWGRDTVKKTIWIDHLIRRIQKTTARGVVVTDVRFANEVDALRSVGGTIWKVVRHAGCVSGAEMAHSSEAGIPDESIDTHVTNHGTLADLEAAVDAAITGIAAGRM